MNTNNFANKEFRSIQVENKKIHSPLLSVVMPVYNPGKYFAPCLDSVLGQTFRDFELIAIDDCSKDDSYKFMQEYAAEDERMIPLANEVNSGAAITRNRGLHLARGKYIIFLDADDYIEKEYFENVISALEKSNADVAACPIYVRNEQNGSESIAGCLPDNLLNRISGVFSPSEFADDILKRLTPAPYNKIIRREYLMKEHIEFQNLSNCNDLYFGWMSVASAKKMVYLTTPYVHYRAETGNQISSNRYKKIMCVCDAYEKIYQDLKKRDLWQSFRRCYHDSVVSALGRTFSKADDPRSVIEYIRGEGGIRLDLVNLKRDDFSCNRAYGMYQAFVCDELSLFGGFKKGIVTFFKMLFTRKFYAAYWLAGHYGKSFLQGKDGRD